jgi:hypothetical protein
VSEHAVAAPEKPTNPTKRSAQSILRSAQGYGDKSPSFGDECIESGERRFTMQGGAPGRANSSIAPSIVHTVLGSSGQPLASGTRNLMESRLGHDFSQVRVHNDLQAAASADQVKALAYTVGSDIVFGRQYQPGTLEGQWLLAHELTHVVQQRHVSAPTWQNYLSLGAEHDGYEQEADARATAVVTGRPVARTYSQLLAPSIQRVPFWEKFLRFIGFEGNFSDPELQAYLDFLDRNNRIEDHFDSDNKAREIVRRWMASQSGYTLTQERKVLLIREMISGFTGDDDEAAILDLLVGSSDAELTFILSRVTPSELTDEIHGEERRQLAQILAGWQARTGAVGARDLFAGTHAVTPTEHAFVESVLTPGATLAPPPPPVGGAPPLPPVVVPPPAMTGLPPAPGTPGAFETDMVAAMKSYLGILGANFRALKAAGPPAFPIARANSIATAAQQQVEAHFSPYLRVASRAPANPYHPGSYSLTSVLGDQSTVPITDTGTAAAPGVLPRPGRIGWMGYWMQQDSSGGLAVMNKYNCVPTRSPDDAEFARVRNLIATDPANRADIDDTIHGWPAEASAGVNIQPYQSVTVPEDARRNRWDLFTTLIHEMMHVTQHPNFERTYLLIGGDAQEILREGFADVMRHDLWDGPGALSTRLATPTLSPVRRQVEGGDYPYDPGVIQYHADYGNQYVKAREIVNGAGGNPGVGMNNAKAAFFLGHTELLGLGAGTATAGGVSLAGVASYSPTGSAEAEIVVVGAGDTYASIQSKTNAPANGILNAAGAPLAPGAALAPGTRLRIPGIRYVNAIQEDTLGSIATQHGVSVADLARANNLPAGTPSSHIFPAGFRVLIPIHAV